MAFSPFVTGRILKRMAVDVVGVSLALADATSHSYRFAAALGQALPGAVRHAAAAAGQVAGLGLRIAAVGLQLLGFAQIAKFAFGQLSKSVKEAQAISDLADNVALTKTEVQKLQVAARATGTEFDALVRVVQELRKSQAEAQGGNKEAIENFAKLGLTLKQVTSATPAELLLLLGQRLKNAAVSSNEFNAAFAVGGKSIRELSSAFRDGFSEIADEAEQAGLLVRESTVSALDAAGDAWDKLMAKFSAGWKTFRSEAVLGTSNVLKFAAAAGANLLSPFSRGAGAFRDEQLEEISLRQNDPGSTARLEQVLNNKREARRAAAAARQEAALKEETAARKELSGLVEADEALTLSKLNNEDRLTALKQKQVTLEKELRRPVEQNSEAIKLKAAVAKDLLGIDQAIKAANEQIEASKKRQLDSDRQIAEARGRVRDAEREGFLVRQDRSKFTLRELAESNVRFSGRLGGEQQQAREALQLERFAEINRQRGFGDLSVSQFSRAEQIRRGLTNLTETERFPFKSLDENVKSQTAAVTELVRKAKEEGLNVQARGG